MTIRGTISLFLRRVKQFVTWILSTVKTISEFLDKIKWLGVAYAAIVTTSHLKTCNDKDKVETKLTQVVAAKTQDSVKCVKAYTDTIIKIKHLSK